MKYLLTGATGYLGSALAKALVSSGHQLVLLKRPASSLRRVAALLDRVATYDSDPDGIAAAFDRHAPFAAVLHTATCYGRQGEDLAAVAAANLLFPLTLLDRCRKGGAPLFVNTDTALPAGVSPYALSKSQFAAWGLRVAAAGEVRWLNLRLEHFYGPGDDPGKFLTWLTRQCLSGVPEIPLTAGEQQRDFIFIDDVVRAVQTVLDADDAATVREYAIGSGEAIALRQIAERLCGLCNAPTRLHFGAVPYRAEEAMISRAEIAPLQALGWAPQVPLLDEGLIRLVQAEKESLGI